jgi:glutamate-5-semialdehyde dehydrogenase
MSILAALQQVQVTSRKIVTLEEAKITSIISDFAALSLQQQSYLFEENQKDLDRMDKQNPKYDRLLINEARLNTIVADLQKVAALPSPLHQVLETKILDNGLHLQRITVPLGVVGIIYESRPNVTFDVFALCLKSGNASVLKGSREAHFSNIAIFQIIESVLADYGLLGIAYLAPSEREALATILNAVGYIDVIIPRGGQGLIDYVRENARVPVIETGAGIVHAYFDEDGDLAKGQAIVENSKARRVSVCNALDTLIVHHNRLSDLPLLVKALKEKHQCEIYADTPAYQALQAYYPENLLHLADETNFGIEFLAMKMAIKTVTSFEIALEHIAKYGSKHSETIISEDRNTINAFLQQVDAAVVYANTSTAFTDGSQFGLGAEIGISTQKLHARGPMALRELTSYKWLVRGDGQVRE